MAKKHVALILTAALILSACFGLAGCSDKEQLKIVYLGDSIAEAVLGPSPLSERENYGYYALIGKRNNYQYINRSVSGHKTSAMLEFISEEDKGATMTKSHIMEADIIHVSILGNDMLQSDVGALLLEMVKEDKGLVTNSPVRDKILEGSKANFAAIVAKLRELNPDAVIFFQTVYNPIYPETNMINANMREALAAYDYTPADYRRLGGLLIQSLNNVAHEYLANNPDSFYIIDAYEGMGRVSDADEDIGRKLIYPDGVHPSNEGHAVLADLTQAKLEELGLADKKTALKNYINHRLTQLKESFPDANTKENKKAIKNAESCEEVTHLFFRAIDGMIPIYF